MIDMSKLQAALEWASRGFPVFPITPNGKEPAFGDDWTSVATTDPALIRSYWTHPLRPAQELDYNIGVDCSNMIVVDIDVKQGKDGYNQYMLLGGTFDSLTVQTPTGGYHVYYDGEPVSNSPIAKDVDIRSHHGYVLAPGSTIDGVAYEVVVDKPVSWIPVEIDRLTTARYSRRDIEFTGELDSVASIQGAINFLQTTPPAIEGQRGDETTFITAARCVREFGLTVQTAYNLMAEHFNPRCEPPWQLDELYAKVENAAQYGTADQGKLAPEIVFAATASLPPPPPSLKTQLLSRVSELGLWGNSLIGEAIPPRPWLLDKLLMIGEVTLLVAPGGAGKSSLGLAVAAHLALGLPFGPYRTHSCVKSIVFNGEDDITEQSRRLYAVCMAYGLPYQEVKESIMLLDAETFDVKVVTAPGKTAVVQTDVVDALIEMCADNDVGLLLVDPLVDLHDCDEGDNPQMNVVMKTMKHIAKHGNVAVMVAHHTTKAGSQRQEDRVGNADIGRGASAIVNKTRTAVTLLSASDADVEDFGIPDKERHLWVRLDDAKMNLALADGNPVWFRKEGMRIPNGDVVGVLKYTVRQRDNTNVQTEMAKVLIGTLTSNGQGSMPLQQAVAVLKANLPLMANKTDADVKKRIEGVFATAKEIDGRTVQCVRDTAGKALITLC